LFGAKAGGITPPDTQGLANVAKSYLHPMIMFGGSFSKQQDGYSSQITKLRAQIDAFETKAVAYQSRQKAKFAALEVALSAIASQGTALTGMLKSLEAQTSTK